MRTRAAERVVHAMAGLPRRLRTRLARTVSAPVIALLYHRVVPTIGRDPQRLAVSAENFAAHLAWLSHRAELIDEAVFLDVLEMRRRSRRPRVLITFDDGYADNVHHAMPLLRKERVPAVLFVTSAAVDSGRPFAWDAPKPDDPLQRPLTWDELRAWRAAGLAVGAHSRMHPRFSTLNEEPLQGEVGGSKAELEAACGAPMRMFAYPFGQREDFDERARDAVRTAGFACAFANWPGNIRWACDRFALPRYLVRDWSSAAFAARCEAWLR